MNNLDITNAAVRGTLLFGVNRFDPPKISMEHYRCGNHRYTFQIKAMREWVQKKSFGKVLNLFAGPTLLGLNEVRNDLSQDVEADYHMDALDCVMQWNTPTFDTIILDPPYSYRKSMEFYGGRKASRFRQVKDWIPKILNPKGRVITFGYHSVSMGQARGFTLEDVAVFSHGGAIHDTIATMELYRT